MRRRLLALVLALALPLCLGAAAASAGAASPSTVFAPYVDLTAWPTPDLAALERASAIRSVTLAFVTASQTTRCAPSWGGQPTEPAAGSRAWDRAGIAAFTATGATDAISFGGEDGAELATICSSAAALEHAYAGVLAAYHPSRLDFDIEGAALQNGPANARRDAALAQLQRAHPGIAISLTLPVLPSGLTPAGVSVVRGALRRHVRIAQINLMTMDYGDSAAPRPSGHMGAYAIAAAAHTLRQLRRLDPSRSLSQREQMIGVTPMIGHNDTTDESFSLTDAAQVSAWARAHHIGLLSMWALQRDRACPGAQQGASDACSGIVQTPYAFSHAFGG